MAHPPMCDPAGTPPATNPIAASARIPATRRRVQDLVRRSTAITAVSTTAMPVMSLITGMAVVLTAVIAVDRLTRSWTRRRVAGILALAAIGFVAGGVPAGSHIGGWAIAGLLMSLGLVAVYVTLVRFDPTLVPLALGTMGAIRAAGLVAQRPFPGAAFGGVLAAVVVSALSWWWFRLLRRVV